MRMRIGGILFLLVLRLVINGLQIKTCSNGQLIRIAGNVERIDQKGTNKIVVIGNFRAIFESNPWLELPGKASVIGRCRRGLIEVLRGQISLIDPRIEHSERVKKSEFGVVSAIRQLRLNMGRNLSRQLPDPEAGLLAGILIGEKSGIGKKFRESLINSGTIHIAVASGYNISIVGLVVMAMFSKVLKRKWASVLAILAIVLYVILAGGEPPVVRAAIMGGLVIVAKVVGRQARSGWLLLMAVLVMILVRPSIIEEVSFQLSIAATIGIIWLAPILVRFFERFRNSLISTLLRLEFATTLSAQILTAPILWLSFGRVSLVGLISNLVVLPLIPPVMAVGLIQVLLNLIYEPFGQLVVPLSYSLLHLIVVLVEFFGYSSKT